MKNALSQNFEDNNKIKKILDLPTLNLNGFFFDVIPHSSIKCYQNQLSSFAQSC